MKIIWRDNDFTLFILNKYDDLNLKKYVKDVLVKIKKRFARKISGFYNVTVYKNDVVGLILDFEKDDNYDFFSDIIDLNISVFENSDMYLEFDNPHLIDRKYFVYYVDDKYYLNVNDLTLLEFLKFIEFSEIKYGDNFTIVNKNMRLVNL